MLTATSVYVFVTPGGTDLLDQLIARTGDLLVQWSVTQNGEAVVAFRLAGGEGAAITVADQLAKGLPYTLHTGVGAHRREIHTQA